MNRYLLLLLPGLLAMVPGLGCYALKKSSGGGQTHFTGTREIDPSDVALPSGYRIEAVASGLTFPTGVTFDAEGRPCVVEAGYSYGEVWTRPRLVRVGPGGALTELAAGGKNGPWTGVAFFDGDFYIAEGGQLEGGRILRVSPDGKATALVSDLPSFGDHHTDGPVVGPDGWVYFGQGTASNSGVVGEDNAQFGWLKRKPEFRDIPGQDITLTGENFETANVLTGNGKVKTGAFQPFGTPAARGQVVKGQVKCSGAILRVRSRGGEPELVAWGFRNPFGLAFDGSGRLYATDNGYDDRGSRPVWGAPDVLWEVRPGTWYGWPDYVAGLPLSGGHFKPPFKSAPKFLLAHHPNTPPRPTAKFGVHSSANGFDFSRNPAFGHDGAAFVALFGDQAPAVGKVMQSVGNKVVRVDVRTGAIEEFAVNKGKVNGPASKIGGGGLERPIAARFDPAGESLYIVDFGVLLQRGKTSLPQKETGVLWRVWRERKANGGAPERSHR